MVNLWFVPLEWGLHINQTCCYCERVEWLCWVCWWNLLMKSVFEFWFERVSFLFSAAGLESRVGFGLLRIAAATCATATGTPQREIWGIELMGQWQAAKVGMILVWFGPSYGPACDGFWGLMISNNNEIEAHIVVHSLLIICVIIMSAGRAPLLVGNCVQHELGIPLTNGYLMRLDSFHGQCAWKHPQCCTGSGVSQKTHQWYNSVWC